MFNNYPLGFYSAATLVKDAQRHGLHFLPLDINRSQYEFTVESEPPVVTGGEEPTTGVFKSTRYRSATSGPPHTWGGSDKESEPPVVTGGLIAAEKKVRVGLKYVRGLRKEIAEKIVAEREKNIFTSVADLIDRVPEINKREIRALSIAGALNFDNTVHRRQALWESELEIQPKGDLFENAELGMMNDESEEHSSFIIPNSSFLQKMEGLQLVDADLRKTGISIGRHPMSFMREALKNQGVLSAEESKNLSAGDIASVAGAVIVRQRPMTAKNVVFITLEDETGHSNFVVMPDIFERYRETITQNSFLIIRGIFEDRGMIKALHFKPLTEITTEVVSHNFR
jgi:error-prone DNA polymerase